MAKASTGISIKSCEECETMNCAVRIMRALQFRRSNGYTGITKEINFRSAISFDNTSQEIVINEELLMQAIMLANPGQKRRRIRLISESDFEKYSSIPPIISFKKVGQGDSISYKEKNVDAGIVFDDNSIRVQAGRINLESDIQYQRSLPEDDCSR